MVGSSRLEYDWKWIMFQYGNLQKVMILELALSSKHDLFCGTNPAKILVGKGPVKI